jgi:hypothetical protein
MVKKIALLPRPTARPDAICFRLHRSPGTNRFSSIVDEAVAVGRGSSRPCWLLDLLEEVGAGGDGRQGGKKCETECPAPLAHPGSRLLLEAAAHESIAWLREGRRVKVFARRIGRSYGAPCFPAPRLPPDRRRKLQAG